MCSSQFILYGWDEEGKGKYKANVWSETEERKVENNIAEKGSTCSEKERESGGGEKAGLQKRKEAVMGMRTGNKEEESTKFRKRRELVKSEGDGASPKDFNFSLFLIQNLQLHS